MNNKAKKLLLAFYFGSLTEDERLLVERELLSDPESLINYLDLKRQVEAAASVSATPSHHLWQRLRPIVIKKKTIWISLSLGSAVAAGIILFFFLNFSQPEELKPFSLNNILIDTSSELPVSSGVL